jgi:hypothetical protein
MACFEKNGAANVVVFAEQARHDLDLGHFDDVRESLQDIKTNARLICDWLQQLNEAGVEVPDVLTWTSFVNRRGREK